MGTETVCRETTAHMRTGFFPQVLPRELALFGPQIDAGLDSALHGTTPASATRPESKHRRELGKHSLVVGGEVVGVGGVVALTRVPDVVGVRCLVRVLLDCVVGIASHEETVQGSALPRETTLWHVLRLLHRLVDDTFAFRGLDHCSEWLQVRAVVPLVLTPWGAISEVLSEG